MFKNASGLIIIGTLIYAFLAFVYGLLRQDIFVSAYGAAVAWVFIRALGLHHASWNERQKRATVPHYRLFAYLVSFGLMAVYAAYWILVGF